MGIIFFEYFFYLFFFFFFRILTDLQNNDTNSVNGAKSNVENNTNEAESDIATALAINNFMKSDHAFEKPSNNVEIDEVNIITKYFK